MFNAFLTALLHKIVSYLASNKDFFDKNESEKKAMLKDLSIPSSFDAYMLNVRAEDFMKDVKLILLYTRDGKKSPIKGNAFFEAVVSFFTDELSRKIDYLDGDFYLLSKVDQRAFIEKLIANGSLLAQTLRTLFLNYSYQQIVHEIHALAERVGKTHMIIVQVPRNIDIELRKEIRQKLSDKYSNSLPIFQINKKLIGGLRIFKDGQSIDHSWLSRVLQFTSLTTA